MYIGKRYYANGPQFGVFGADKAAEIHAASCRVLQEQGMVVKHEGACEMLKAAGALVEGDKVFVSASLVERALKQLPLAHHALRPRRESRDVPRGGATSITAPARTR